MILSQMALSQVTIYRECWAENPFETMFLETF